jgi:hypothetical protein
MLKNKTILDWVAFVIVVVGAVNWGLYGTLNFDLIDFLFHRIPLLARVVYAVVGLAGIYLLYAVAKPDGSPNPARTPFRTSSPAPQMPPKQPGQNL